MSNQKVYVLFFRISAYDGDVLLGVYSSMEKLEKARDAEMDRVFVHGHPDDKKASKKSKDKYRSQLIHKEIEMDADPYTVEEVM